MGAEIEMLQLQAVALATVLGMPRTVSKPSEAEKDHKDSPL